MCYRSLLLIGSSISGNRRSVAAAIYTTKSEDIASDFSSLIFWYQLPDFLGLSLPSFPVSFISQSVAVYQDSIRCIVKRSEARRLPPTPITTNPHRCYSQ